MEDLVLFVGVLMTISMLIGISRMSRAPGKVDAQKRQIEELTRRLNNLERKRNKRN
jgi:ubiquinone biosynthesis protein UbiJ